MQSISVYLAVNRWVNNTLDVFSSVLYNNVREAKLASTQTTPADRYPAIVIRQNLSQEPFSNNRSGVVHPQTATMQTVA